MAVRALPTIKSHLEMIKPVAGGYMKEEESDPSRVGRRAARPSR
jgi:hypothetical protein